MPSHKILLSNVGYARGINGGLNHHMRYAHRHLFCSQRVQEQALGQLAAIIAQESPDICCFVEIDNGSFSSANFNQLEALITEEFSFYDIENKYGAGSILRKLALTRGKSNAFLAKQRFAFEKIHFTHGTKKLIYKITLQEGVTLFFAHFSLKRLVRARQLTQARELMENTSGESIFLGDFNVLTGFSELEPLLKGSGFVLMNKHDAPTFTFHKRKLVLDLCICTPGIAQRTAVKIIPQPYSDHAALVAEVQFG